MRLWKFAEEDNELTNEQRYILAARPLSVAYTEAANGINLFLKKCKKCTSASEFANITIPEDFMELLFGISPSGLEDAVMEAEDHESLLPLQEMVSKIESVAGSSFLTIAMNAAGIAFTLEVGSLGDEGPESQFSFLKSATNFFYELTSTLKARVTIPGEVANVIVAALVEAKVLSSGESNEVRLPVGKKDEDTGDNVEKVKDSDNTLGKFTPTIAFDDSLLMIDENISAIITRVGGEYRDPLMGLSEIELEEFRAALIESLKDLAKMTSVPLSFIRSEVESNDRNVKQYVDKLVVSLAANELSVLMEGKVIGKHSIAPLKGNPGIPSAVNFLKESFPELLGPVSDKRYNSIREKSADFIRMFKVMERIAAHEKSTPDDFTAIQASAEKQKEFLSPDRHNHEVQSLPITDKRRVSELKRLVKMEAKKNSDFLFFSIFTNTPSVLPADADKAFGLLYASPRIAQRNFDISQKIVFSTVDDIKSISVNGKEGLIERASRMVNVRPKDRITVTSTNHLNGTYRVTEVDDSGIHFKFDSAIPQASESSGRFSIASSTTYVGATEANSCQKSNEPGFQVERSWLGKDNKIKRKNQNIIGSIEAAIGGPGPENPYAGLNLLGTKHKGKSNFAIADDPLTGSPTTIDAERIIRLGGALDAECKLVPKWQPGGEYSKFNPSLMRDKIHELFAAYVIHSHVGVQSGGLERVSTLYDVVMARLQSELEAAEKSGDQRRARLALDKIVAFCSGAPDFESADGRERHVNACPWLSPPKRPGDKKDFYLSLPSYGEGADTRKVSQPYKTYSGRTAEAGLVLGKSIVFLIKSYLNSGGVLRTPQDGMAVVSSLTLDGVGVIDMLVDEIVKGVSTAVGVYGASGERSIVSSFKRAKDKVFFLFGADKDAITATALKSIGDNLSGLFVSGSGGGGLPALASNTRQYSELIGRLVYDLSSSTGMMGGKAFDIASVIARNGVSKFRDTAPMFGVRARNLMRAVRGVVDSMAFKTDISDDDYSHTAKESTIRLSSRDKIIPTILARSTFSIYAPSDTGEDKVIASVDCSRKPVVRIDGDQISITFRPGFGDIEIPSGAYAKVDYGSAIPEPEELVLQKMYTGRHLDYAEGMAEELNGLNALVEEAKGSKLADLIVLRKLFDKLGKFQKSVWNTLAVLPSMETLASYARAPGQPGGYLELDMEKVVESLKAINRGIKKVRDDIGKYLPK